MTKLIDIFPVNMNASCNSLNDEEVITFGKTTKRTKDFLESSDEELMNDCNLHSTPLSG